jgi:DNA-binding FrmR family transcriptional regulator
MNSKQKTLISFKKARSLITKIIRMIEDNQYCIDIMQQNLAALGLLKSAHQELLKNHLNTCVKKGLSSRNRQKQTQLIQEILQVTKLSNR